MSVLEVRDLSIRFGGLQALSEVSLSVGEFEIVGLIGPNGAGKTTAFNCITGFYQPDTGKVLYRGEDVTGLKPHEKAGLGFGRTFQNVGMVKSATALENLKTAQHLHAGYDTLTGLLGVGRSWAAERRMSARADAVLDLLGLSHIRNQAVGGQSYGTLKLLELGCAIATEPDILLLDEPTSGMGPDESDELGERLLVLRREFGLTMLVIEHHVPLVLRVCDHVYVLNFGKLLAAGTPSEVQVHPEVVAAYLGGPEPSAEERAEELGAPEAGTEKAAAENLVAQSSTAEDPETTSEAALPAQPARALPVRTRSPGAASRRPKLSENPQSSEKEPRPRKKASVKPPAKARALAPSEAAETTEGAAPAEATPRGRRRVAGVAPRPLAEEEP